MLKMKDINVHFYADESSYYKNSIHFIIFEGNLQFKLYNGVVRMHRRQDGCWVSMLKLATCSLLTSLYVNKKLCAKCSKKFSSYAKFPVSCKTMQMIQFPCQYLFVYLYQFFWLIWNLFSAITATKYKHHSLFPVSSYGNIAAGLIHRQN